MGSSPACPRPPGDQAAAGRAGRRRTSPAFAGGGILAAARQELPELTAQSVYVVLGDLTDLHMLRRFEPPHSPALYETRVGDNHHHAVCISCGRVEDVDCAVGHAPCLTPHWDENAKPMTIQIADVLYQGICQDCQRTQQLPSERN